MKVIELEKDVYTVSAVAEDQKEVRKAVKLRNSYLESGTVEFLDPDNC